jgi:hypothetical protein
MSKPFSIRLSQKIQDMLASIQKQSERHTNQSLGVSEIIHTILENSSATGNMLLEIAELWDNEAESLENIRALLTINAPLSQSKLLFIVQLAHEYTDSPDAARRPNSDWLILINAVDALFELPVGKDHQHYYLSNLGIYHSEEKDFSSLSFREATRKLLAESRDKFKTFTEWKLSSEMIARNLEVAIRDEKYNESKLNDVLRPYLGDILRLAIREYVRKSGKPLKIGFGNTRTMFQHLPHISENDLEISMICGDNGEILSLISFKDSAFTLNSISELLTILHSLEARDGTPNTNLSAYTLEKDRVAISTERSLHYFSEETASKLVFHIKNIIKSNEHSEIIRANLDAYGE